MTAATRPASCASPAATTNSTTSRPATRSTSWSATTTRPRSRRPERKRPPHRVLPAVNPKLSLRVGHARLEPARVRRINRQRLDACPNARREAGKEGRAERGRLEIGGALHGHRKDIGEELA